MDLRDLIVLRKPDTRWPPTGDGTDTGAVGSVLAPSCPHLSLPLARSLPPEAAKGRLPAAAPQAPLSCLHANIKCASLRKLGTLPVPLSCFHLGRTCRGSGFIATTGDDGEGKVSGKKETRTHIHNAHMYTHTHTYIYTHMPHAHTMHACMHIYMHTHAHTTETTHTCTHEHT